MMTVDDIHEFAGDKFISTDDLAGVLDMAVSERQSLVDRRDDAENPLEEQDLAREIALWDGENGEALKQLGEVCEDLPEGEQLIRESEIDNYLYDMVVECYPIPQKLPSFMTLTIDYDALKQEYYEVEYGNHTYFVRYT